MRLRTRDVWGVLLAVGLAAGCKLSADEQSAVDACRKHGNNSPACQMANRMLASGAGGIEKALGAEMQAQQAGDQARAAAAAKEEAMRAEGIDPCAKLAEMITAKHPAAACAPKVAEAVEWLKGDPGCAQALDGGAATEDTVADLLGDCDKAAP